MNMKLMNSQLLGKKFQTIYHVLCRILCGATFLFQAAILDYYLYRGPIPSSDNSSLSTLPVCSNATLRGNRTMSCRHVSESSQLWLLWIAADVVVFVLFVISFVISYRHHQTRHVTGRKSAFISSAWGGDLPLSYVTWCLYAATLAAKVCLLYNLPDSIAVSLNESLTLGPNCLATVVSLSSVVLYLFVLTNHDAKTRSEQNEFVQDTIGDGYLDLLDTTQFLSVLLGDGQLVAANGMDNLVLTVICFNYILPTEALFVLSRTHFGKFPFSPKYQLLHKVLYFLIVNTPMFVIRMLIWHLHDQIISVFIIKNVISIGLAIKEVHEFVVEVKDVIVSESRRNEHEMKPVGNVQLRRRPETVDDDHDELSDEQIDELMKVPVPLYQPVDNGSTNEQH